ncbi:hypothetical protein A8709_27780 [Paenibacillus pectinilyticus]|uniref:FAD:protein FMN transferase n=1 Tax=Paenibacillus pectinilyticus TaxID=512399 RepID=A0A1C0ZUF4_9BACL|nr:FAD:protein FMN transferase [Paenibacillus pectinilyticus]OCT11678.1 hypothetical protein A8709_27780 [Paenibacillus pectinilyticus]
MFHELTFRAMNTRMQVLVESETPLVMLESPILDGFSHAEERFSRFLPNSECSYLNARSGQTSIVSNSMMEVLTLSRHYQEQTNGAFDICVGHALQRAGYRQSFERIKGRTMQVEHNSPISSSSEALHMDPWMKSIRIPSHKQLDFGGIVKSWTAQQVAHQLRKEWQVARGLISAGGDVVVWGGAAINQPWIVGIENPFAVDESDEATLQLAIGAVATSSTLRRRWRTNEGEMHHLMDTRTMRPSTSTVVQCTVVGKDVIACEVWAKVLCMLGIDEGVPLFRRRTEGMGMEAILYTSSGDLFQLKSAANDLAYEWKGLKGARHL